MISGVKYERIEKGVKKNRNVIEGNGKEEDGNKMISGTGVSTGRRIILNREMMEQSQRK